MKTEAILELFRQDWVCHENCIGCEKYKTAKERKTCPTHKLRGKFIRHCTYLRQKEMEAK